MELTFAMKYQPWLAVGKTYRMTLASLSAYLSGCSYLHLSVTELLVAIKYNCSVLFRYSYVYNATLNVYIDESGIQFKDWHSVFVIVFIMTESELKITQGIDQLTFDVNGISLQWSKMGKRVKAKVIPAMASLPFRYSIIVIPNPLRNTESALGASMAQILSNMEINAIIIDGAQSKRQIAQLKRLTRGNPTMATKFAELDKGKNTY